MYKTGDTKVVTVTEADSVYTSETRGFAGWHGAFDCPFSRAVRRAFGVDRAGVCHADTSVGEVNDGRCYLGVWDHPGELREAIAAWDAYNTPIPSGDYTLTYREY